MVHTHIPKPVCEDGDVTVLWNQAVRTDREVTANRPDIIIENKKEKTCTLIQAEECIAWSFETGILRWFGCLFLNSLNEIVFQKTLINGCSQFVGYWLQLSYFQVKTFKKLFL